MNTVPQFAKGTFVWFNDEEISGLPGFIEEFKQKYHVYNVGNEKESTELKCHLLALGLVAFIACGCGTGLLISQIEGGLDPALCLMGISVGFVIGMIVAYQLTKYKQKMIAQTYISYLDEKVSFDELLPVLKKCGEGTIRAFVGGLSDQKKYALLSAVIHHYMQLENPDQELICLAGTLMGAVYGIPLISEMEKSDWPQFIAEYEKKSFDPRQSSQDDEQAFIARIFYLCTNPKWVKANPDISKRYFNLYVSRGHHLRLFLDLLMQQHPALIQSCTIKYQEMPLKIPVLRLLSVSPSFANMFEDLGGIRSDTEIPIDGSYKCSEETVLLLFEYFFYGNRVSIPLLEHARLTQCLQLEHFAIECDLPDENFADTLQTAIEEDLYDIQWMGLVKIFANPEWAKTLKNTERDSLNAFIDYALDLEKSIPILSYEPSTVKMNQSSHFGSYFYTTRAKRIFSINRPLSMEQLFWLKKHTACDWDVCTPSRALEQCHACLQAKETFLAEQFLDCAEKLLKQSQKDIPLGYAWERNLLTDAQLDSQDRQLGYLKAGDPFLAQIYHHRSTQFSEYATSLKMEYPILGGEVQTEVFSSIESMRTLYHFAQQKQAKHVVDALLKTLQAKTDVADIVAILAAGHEDNLEDWLCIGFELMTKVGEITNLSGLLSFNMPHNVYFDMSKGTDCKFYRLKVQYRAGERRFIFAHLVELDNDSITKVVTLATELHKIFGITHLYATSKDWDTMGTQLDHLPVTKRFLSQQV